MSFSFDKITFQKWEISHFSINWITKKVRSLLPSKDKKIYPACKINRGFCFCQENYTGESKRNTANR